MYCIEMKQTKYYREKKARRRDFYLFRWICSKCTMCLQNETSLNIYACIWIVVSLAIVTIVVIVFICKIEKKKKIRSAFVYLCVIDVRYVLYRFTIFYLLLWLCLSFASYFVYFFFFHFLCIKFTANDLLPNSKHFR